MSFKTALKALIDALFTRTIEGVSPGAALYSETRVNSSGTRVTSPVNGFARVNTGLATKDGGYVNLGFGNIAHLHVTKSGYSSRLDIPVKKGESVQVDFSGVGSVTLGFIERVGMGG